MKKIKLLSALSLFGLMISCTKSEEPLKESQIITPVVVKNDVDKMIDEVFLNPYNIEVLYRWNPSVVDNNRYLFPPTYEKVKPALEIVQNIWLKTYNEIGGNDFVKKISPRQLVLVGGVNLNTTGTVTLGIAEGGVRITLFETDNVVKTNRASVKQFIHTIQHEYIHILNQTKRFDETAMQKITPSGYSSNWYATGDSVAREQGFVTAYARSNFMEDFAETATMMLVNSRAEYNAIINSITSTTAKASIKAKEAIVYRYFKEVFNINFDDLRNAAEANTNAVVAGN